MRTLRSTLSGVLLVALLCGTVNAGLIGSEFITIEAQSSAGAGSVGVEIPPDFIFPRDGIFQYQLPSPVEIRTPGNQLIATLNTLSLRIEEDPAIALNFSATAGSTDTTFTVASAVLTFAPLTNAQGFATAALTLTDNNGNSAALTGLESGHAYRALYNGGTTFATLVPSFNTPAFASATASQRSPVLPTIFTPIAGSVSSMQAIMNFSITAEDQASMTSRFEIIPEPTSLALIGLAAGAMFARRRRIA